MQKNLVDRLYSRMHNNPYKVLICNCVMKILYGVIWILPTHITSFTCGEILYTLISLNDKKYQFVLILQEFTCILNLLQNSWETKQKTIQEQSKLINKSQITFFYSLGLTLK